MAVTKNVQKLPFPVSSRSVSAGQWILYAGFALTLSFLLVLFIVITYPLLWMVINSFKSTEEIFTNTWSLPSQWRFSNYVTAWNKGISNYFMNSVIVTVITCFFTILVSGLGAYGLTRFNFKWKTAILVLISSGLMFSAQVSLIPLYKLNQALGIQDTYWAIILPYIAYRIPFTVLLIRTFFLSIPKDYEEAASIEGCSSLGILFRIYFPISRPVILTGILMTAYYAWNEIMFSNIFIDSEQLKPITAGLLVFRDVLYTDWGLLMAGVSISSIPMIALFIAIQKQFVRGLAEGGVKG